MKNLFLCLVLFIGVSAQAQSLGNIQSARFLPKFEIPLYESGWTVIQNPALNAERPNTFSDTASVVCGIMVPSGAGQSASVKAHWDLYTNSIAVTERFIRFHLKTSTGYELTVLCGKGFNREQGLFSQIPNLNEVRDLLQNYFAITATF